MIKFAIIALDGCYGSSLHGLVDVLVVANAHIAKESGDDTPFFSWQFFTSAQQKISTSNGLEMNEPLVEHSEQVFDVIFIPGIYYQGVKAFSEKLKSYQDLYQWLQTQHEQGAVICANCTSTFLLAQSGLLKGKQCTTIWWLEHLFKQRYSDTLLNFDELIIEDSNVLTAGAATSHFQLGLRLLKRFTSELIVQQTAKAMLIDTRTVHVSPEQLLNLAREHNNPLVQKAQEWINDHLHEPFTVKELATHIACTERTLTRQFKDVLAVTPVKYIQNLRINRAKYLLENSEFSLEKIIDKVGYKDRSTFSKLFSSQTGLPPMSYRRQFSKAGMS
ncbi:helix-turn-helix domain-containing protein [Thalassotalea nanhaiensis]|uniref:Helix-turn-helix domain-containing protein n=1 Tax=Thalassotalea nanhaiensis TaxID=3065648 RepID=A0ABY9TE56_9GAMM|nr:helix-turn-helix domain-containing protein [Colwelliaceae bacterium SQ345]